MQRVTIETVFLGSAAIEKSGDNSDCLNRLVHGQYVVVKTYDLPALIDDIIIYRND